MTAWKRSALIALTAAPLLLPTLAGAESSPTKPTKTAAPSAADRAAAQAAKREEWTRKHQDLQARQAKLQSDLTQARADYSRGRSRRRLQGEGRPGLVAEIQRLEKELAETDRELREFPETARRGGALPGWFRDDGPAAPAAPTAAPAATQPTPRTGDRVHQRSTTTRRVGQRDPRDSRNSTDRGASTTRNDEATAEPSRSDRRAQERERRRLGR